MFLLLFAISAMGQQLSNDEKELYELMNEYRVKNKLSELPLSDKLCEVAKLHLINVDENIDKYEYRGMSPHSWFPDKRWKTDIFPDGSSDGKIENKPYEITGYDGAGYEVYYWDSNNHPKPKEIMEGWIRSIGHRNTLINKGCYKDTNWLYCGVSIYKGHACIWVGDDTK